MRKNGVILNINRTSGLVMLMMPTQLQQLILGVIFLIEVALFSDRKTGMIVK